ncbi:MAG: two-component system phosphate regulon sensor histidine kinase PhoR [Pseudohongiellaceae bacterium]|jgi:two-component system phosphate regulon sensor histidine kinase PhoR
MFRSQLFWRFYAGYIVIILISTLIVGALVSQQVEENNMLEIKHSLAISSELLAEVAKPTLVNASLYLSGSDYLKPLQQKIVLLGQKTESRLTVIDSQGLVIADSQETPQNMDNHNFRPEIIAARAHGFSTVSRFSQTLRQKMVYRAQRVDDGNVILGFVRVSLPVHNIDQKLSLLRLNVIYGAAIAAFSALILGFFFVKHFLSPIVRMTEVAESISKGDFNRRIEINQRDEMGLLARAVNRMALSSSQRMEEITEDRNRLAGILTGMVEGVIYVDENQLIQHINQAALNMLSLSKLTCLDKPIWEQVRIEEITTAVEKAIDTGQVVKTQLCNEPGQAPDHAKDSVIDIYVAAILNENGRSIGVVIVLNDISEIALLERIRRDFVANASHELKTPITAIRALTETILDDEDMAPAISRRFTEKINAQSLRLSSLVTDLMTISRLESDETAKALQVLNFKKIVQNSLADIATACQDKNINVSSQLCADRVQIEADEQAISQLVDNLLDNAVKYTLENGKVMVSMHVNLDRTKVILDVKDNGIGISSQHQKRIFERFYRVDKARSRDLGGTGLGLSIVKNIAEQHGGTVRINSRLGEGTCFTVMLPIM